MTTVTNKNGVTFNIDDIVTDLNGKMDRDALNAIASVCVESWHSGTSWYRVYSDGWCEQGGQITYTTDPYPVILFKNMIDTNYFVSAICYRQNNVTHGWVTVNAKNTSSVTLGMYYDNGAASGTANDAYIIWKVSGYIS